MTDHDLTLTLMRGMTELLQGGVGYVYQGRDPGVDLGLDCHGLLLWLYDRASCPIPDLVLKAQKDGGTRDVAEKSLIAYSSDFVEIPVGHRLRPLDILFLSKWSVVDNHVGVLIDFDQVAHSSERLGITVSPVSVFRKIKASRWFRHQSRFSV